MLFTSIQFLHKINSLHTCIYLHTSTLHPTTLISTCFTDFREKWNCQYSRLLSFVANLFGQFALNSITLLSWVLVRRYKKKNCNLESLFKWKIHPSRATRPFIDLYAIRSKYVRYSGFQHSNVLCISITSVHVRTT